MEDVQYAICEFRKAVWLTYNNISQRCVWDVYPGSKFFHSEFSIKKVPYRIPDPDPQKIEAFLRVTKLLKI